MKKDKEEKRPIMNDPAMIYNSTSKKEESKSAIDIAVSVLLMSVVASITLCVVAGAINFVMWIL